MLDYADRTDRTTDHDPLVTAEELADDLDCGESLALFDDLDTSDLFGQPLTLVRSD